MYLVSDESMLPITFYNRLSHMHGYATEADINRKFNRLPCEAYNAYVFQCHYYMVGFRLRDPPLTDDTHPPP